MPFSNIQIRTLKLIKIICFGKASEKIRLSVSIIQRKGMLSTLAMRNLERYGVYISKNATIGQGLILPHPTAIVIGEKAHIGENVTIYQGVTLGGKVKGDSQRGNYPTISDGCILYAGAAVLGRVHIGKNSIIGANSVVISDIPENSTAAGIPARVVKCHGNES